MNYVVAKLPGQMMVLALDYFDNNLLSHLSTTMASPSKSNVRIHLQARNKVQGIPSTLLAGSSMLIGNVSKSGRRSKDSALLEWRRLREEAHRHRISNRNPKVAIHLTTTLCPTTTLLLSLIHI